MPFSDRIFLRIARAFRITRSTVRTCHRSTSAVFLPAEGCDPGTNSRTLGELLTRVAHEQGARQKTEIHLTKDKSMDWY